MNEAEAAPAPAPAPVEENPLPIVNVDQIPIQPVQWGDTLRINNTQYQAFNIVEGAGVVQQLAWTNIGNINPNTAQVWMGADPNDMHWLDPMIFHRDEGTYTFVRMRMADNSLAWVHQPRLHFVARAPQPLNMGAGIWDAGVMWGNTTTTTYSMPTMPLPPQEENGDVLKVNIDKIATKLADDEFTRIYGEDAYKVKEDGEMEIGDDFVDQYMELYDKYYELISEFKINNNEKTSKTSGTL